MKGVAKVNLMPQENLTLIAEWMALEEYEDVKKSGVAESLAQN